jgi:hypothetical protein
MVKIRTPGHRNLAAMAASRTNPFSFSHLGSKVLFTEIENEPPSNSGVDIGKTAFPRQFQENHYF